MATKFVFLYDTLKNNDNDEIKLISLLYKRNLHIYQH